MKTNLLYLSVIIFALTALTLKSQETNSKRSQKALFKFNQSLESLELKLRDSNYQASCLEAKKTKKIIKSDYSYLKIIEPNYDWEEIRKTLNSVQKKYCAIDLKEKR